MFFINNMTKQVILQQDDVGRSKALLAYWLVFLVGLVMWWMTTSITKHPLPVHEINGLHSTKSLDVDPIRVKGYPGYQVSFTLISSDDVCVDLYPAYSRIFAPRLAVLSKSLAYFKVDLQCRLHASPARPEEGINKFVQSDWNLANSISSLPIINFIIYRGSYNMESKKSFLFPQWGSVYIMAHDDENPNLIMEELFKHFLLLLGIEDSENMDNWYEKETEQCTFKAIDALKSILNILGNNQNMPIPKPVSLAVHNAVANLRQLKHQTLPQTKFGLARNALDEAEAAFFHPAMLARQYFPREHELAVYVPLFVPLLMPLFVQTIRHFYY